MIRLSLVCCALCAFLSSAGAQNEPDPHHFDMEFRLSARLIVMLNVDYGDGSSELGAGFVFGHRGDSLFIATAAHVVHRGQPRHIWVTLRSMPPGHRIEATLLQSSSDPDMAVLGIGGPGGGGIGGLAAQGVNPCAFPYRRLPSSDEPARGDIVYPVGNPNGDAWAEPAEPDKITQVTDNEIVFQSALISPGNSGGPLIDANARFIGMTVADQPPFGRALRMDQLLGTLRKWRYPVQLTRYEDPGLTSLQIAAMKGDNAGVQQRLNACDDPDEVDENYVTALELASNWGNQQAITLLLKAGASVDAQDIRGYTALHGAADRPSNTAVIQMLLKAGANINHKNNDGQTPLSQVLSADSVDAGTALFLIRAGADVNTRDAHKSTPLHLAAQAGITSVARELLRDSAGIDAEDEDNRTPLFLAIRYNHPDIVRLLAASGASMTGHAWLALAIEFTRDADLLTALLQAGAAVDEPDGSGFTPLQDLVLHGRQYREFSVKDQLELMTLLLKRGAGVNTPDAKGRTALALARTVYTKPTSDAAEASAQQTRYKEVERLLLQYGGK